MSRETWNWLNTNTLIGFTDQRGHAWHWRAQEQDGVSNIGPLCRRHHRIKRLGWTKRRRVDGCISWTDPSVRSWTSPAQGFGPAPQPRRTEVCPGVWALAA